MSRTLIRRVKRLEAGQIAAVAPRLTAEDRVRLDDLVQRILDDPAGWPEEHELVMRMQAGEEPARRTHKGRQT